MIKLANYRGKGKGRRRRISEDIGWNTPPLIEKRME
jgi:hypothetical protein